MTVDPKVFDDISEKYVEALIRSRRDTKVNLTVAVYNGWKLDEFRHWVQTGQQPVGKEVFG